MHCNLKQKEQQFYYFTYACDLSNLGSLDCTTSFRKPSVPVAIRYTYNSFNAFAKYMLYADLMSLIPCRGQCSPGDRSSVKFNK